MMHHFSKIIFTVAFLLCPLLAPAQSGFSSFFTRNKYSIELDASLSNYSNSYQKPSSVNQATLSGSKLKLDYDMYDDKGKVTYNHIVTIDFSKTFPEIREHELTGSYGESSMDYYVSFVSYDKIPEAIKSLKDGRSYSTSSNIFNVYCSSYTIAKELYNLSVQAIRSLLPQYESSEAGVKSCFNDIQSIIREYKIVSAQTQRINSSHTRFAKSSGLKIQYSNHILIVSYTDAYDMGVSSSDFTPGKYIFEIPFFDANIRYSGYGYTRDLWIGNEKGVKRQCNNEKTIAKGVSLYADEAVLIDLAQHLFVFQDLIKTTDYAGSLGTSGSSSKNTGKTNGSSSSAEEKKISNKYSL